MAVLNDAGSDRKNDPRFWVASGTILYNVLTLFLFRSFDLLLIQSPGLLKILWHINWYAMIVAYLFYLRAFFCKPVNAGIIHQSQTNRSP
jgi:hypothetical protein